MRQPCVAGSFYPASEKELREKIRFFLKEGKDINFSGKLKALIVPHAGYIYSGKVAGAGFKLLQNKSFSEVILLGPSHYFYFEKVALAEEDFKTPLGIVKRGDLSNWLKEEIFIKNQTLHQPEHCLEVVLPFLQETLKDFKLFALLLGEIEEERLAETLTKFINQKTLLIVSSDLSHGYDYNSAVVLDKKSIEAILNFSFSQEIEACGKKPILTLMYLAKKLGWRPFLIDYQNSGDTAGNKNQVVGYVALGYQE